MNIEIKSIPHEEHRYETIGDWYNVIKAVDPNQEKVLTIRVSEMENANYMFLIALHELVEAWLCQSRGISQTQVDSFDFNSKDEEPGDSSLAPYHREHEFATIVERMMAHEMGIEWGEYEHYLTEVTD